MSSKTINPSSLFFLAYYFSKIFGLLPADLFWKTGLNGCQMPYMKLSKLALPWTALLISIITLKLYNIIFMNLDFFIPPKIEHYIMASKSIDTAHVCLIVITCFFYRFHPTFKCFNKAMKMFPKIKSSDSAPRIRYFSVILFIYNLTLIFIKILFHPSIHSFVFVYIPDFVMTSACLSVSSLIASVNITASLSYKFINRKILDLFTLKNNESLVIKNLSHVSELCWETGELLLLTWKYFSLDLLVRCIFIILKGLYLSHILYNLKKSGLSSNLYQTTSFLTILMWLIEIFVLGKICEEVECQIEETKCLLYKYQQKYYRIMGWRSKQLIQAFILQTESRNIHFSPLGFFRINRALSYNMASITIAYTVLIIQFQKVNN